ncbi:MAG: hypothetical protein DMG86_05625 [Acidobacteria bacterium]|nr:MAG: hypothetical protein DMG86_05625 [Acidobacteriota bacterium]
MGSSRDENFRQDDYVSRDNSPSHSTLPDSAGRAEPRITAIPSTLPLQDFNRSAGAWPSRILPRISAGRHLGSGEQKLVFVAFPGEMVKLAGTALRTAINQTLKHQPQDGSEHPAPAQHAYRPRDSGVVLQHA